MYQLLCHVNVPVPADTCLTRTADRAILDCVPGMKRTVVITVKYYDNFNDFGTPISGASINDGQTMDNSWTTHG